MTVVTPASEDQEIDPLRDAKLRLRARQDRQNEAAARRAAESAEQRRGHVAALASPGRRPR